MPVDILHAWSRSLWEHPENRKQQALFNGVDIVSTAKRLGHSQVSTTSDIYAHVIEQADKKNADILGDILLKKAWIFKASWIKVELSPDLSP